MSAARPPAIEALPAPRRDTPQRAIERRLFEPPASGPFLIADPMTIRAQVMSGLRWTVGARVTGQIITWAITLVVIRILTPADYGLLAMATVCVAFVAMFSELGLGAAVVQRTHVDVMTVRRVYAAILVVHVALASILVLASPLIASFFVEPRVGPIVRTLALLLVVAAFGVVPDSMLQRNMDFRRRSLLDLSAAIVGAVTTLALALTEHGVWALVLGMLVAQVWRTVGVNVVAPFPHWPKFSLTGLRSLITFGGHISAAQVFGFLYSQSDALIAGKFLGKELLGFYSVAMHLASLPNQRIAAILNQVAFPAFSRMQDDLHKVSAGLLVGVRVLSLIAFAVLWGMSSIAPELVHVVLGSKWGPAVMPLQILGLVMPLRMLGNFVPNAVQGVGRADIVLENTVTAALIGPIAFLIGVQWGLRGLSLAWLIATPLVFVVNMSRSLPVLGLRMTQFISATWPAATAGLLMYLSVFGAREILHAQGGFVRLAVLVLTGAAAYVAGSFVFNRQGLREAFALLSEVLRSRSPKSTSDESARKEHRN